MFEYETYQPLRDMANAAVRSQVNTEFPARVLLTVWACESDWGKKLTGAFNFFGITRLPEHGHAVMCSTHEEITPAQLEAFDPRERATAVQGEALSGGKFRYQMRRYFAAYGSMGEAVVEYTEFFTQSPHRYTAAWQQYLEDKDEESLLKHICEAGYATGSAETTEVAIFEQANIDHAVEMAQKANAVPTT